MKPERIKRSRKRASTHEYDADQRAVFESEAKALKAMGIEAMREVVRLFKKDDLTRARYKTAIASSCLERHCCLAELSPQLSKRGWEVRS